MGFSTKCIALVLSLTKVMSIFLCPHVEPILSRSNSADRIARSSSLVECRLFSGAVSALRDLMFVFVSSHDSITTPVVPIWSFNPPSVPIRSADPFFQVVSKFLTLLQVMCPVDSAAHFFVGCSLLAW